MTLNAIALENQKPGNPASEWDLGGAASTAIEGFATRMSVNRGTTVQFKINTAASKYRIDIYRLGYYGGLGARKVTSIQRSTASPQPPPGGDPAIGLHDAGNWSVTASWAVPSTAVSGVYLAKLVRQDGVPGASHIPFVVRADGTTHDIAFQTSDTTWHAYNGWGGASLYGGDATASPDGRAYKVSYNRPIGTRDAVGLYAGPQDYVLSAEYAAIRWLERNGYDVAYLSGVDTGPGNVPLTRFKVFMSTGHDEYWSGEQRAHVEAARDAGVHLVFISGNEVYWKTRWEPDLNGTPNRTLVCYKETRSGAKIDPTAGWTGTWRDPQSSPPADGGRPENSLTGTIFQVDSHRADVIEVPQRMARLRFWRDAPLASTPVGGTARLSEGLLGYEWDESPNNRFRPPGSVHLSSSDIVVHKYLVDYGLTVGVAPATHHLTLHRAPSGAIVFGAGTVFWSFGLDPEHDYTNSGDVPAIGEDRDVQQLMVNVFADMAVQPTTLQSALTAAVATTDTTPPTTVITAPAAGSTAVQQQRLVVTGTASDVGGLVAAVEVSVDGGATWRAATGTADWTFDWWPRLPGQYTIRARAIDDSLNTGAAASVSVTVAPAAGVGLFTPDDVPFTRRSGEFASLELGVRFSVTTPGTATGIRFYKNPDDTSAHVAHLWSGSGTLLAEAEFSDETPSGWQEATFDTPVGLNPGSPYIASYHIVGYYSADTNYYHVGRSSGAVTAPAGANGVYAYGASGTFPADSFNSTNYWADVVFVRAGGAGDLPPTAGNDSGFTTNQGAAIAIPAAALLANDTDPNGYPLSITGVSSPVNGTVTWSAATRTATFTPTSGFSGLATFRYAITNGHNAPVSATVSVNVLAATVRQTLFKPSDTPAVASHPDANAVQVGVKFRCATPDAHATGIRFYKGAQNTGTHVGRLWTASGALLATTTFSGETASGWQEAALGTPVALTEGETYIASYHTAVGHYSANSNAFAVSQTSSALVAPADGTSGGNGVFAYGPSTAFPDSSSNATNYWVDVVVEAPAPAIRSLFDVSDVPATVTVNDAHPVQLGTKFRTSAPDATAVGIRFYKGPQNTGAHVAHLWTATGVLLASATFTGETTSGWQEVTFGTPVPLTPGDTYIASYHTNGWYSASASFFAADHARGSLTAPASAVSGGNGVFTYGPAGSFPGSAFNATNYWVDVVVRSS